MVCVTASRMKKSNKCILFFLSKKRKFNSFHENYKNVDREIFECKEINDHNYNDIVTKEKTLLIYGYANYAYTCLSCFNKLMDIANKGVKDKIDKKFLIFKLNINNNNLLVHKFHIKSIPLVQLRHKNKLIEEIYGNELNNENNLKNILNRYQSYFHSIYDLGNINDFLSREDELSKDGFIEHMQDSLQIDQNSPAKEGKDESSGSASSSSSDKSSNEKSSVDRVQEFFIRDFLNNLELNHQCSSYVLYKKLEVLLNEKPKKMSNAIKLFLNEIIFNHSTYLDINNQYNKITAKAFLYLFDEDNFSSIEKLIELKNYLECEQDITPTKMQDLKLLSLNEPIITFDDFKNIYFKKIKGIDEFFSSEGDQNRITLWLRENTLLNENDKEDNKKIKMGGDIRTVYLSRVYRILAIKYFDIEKYDNSFHYAVESYKLTYPLNNIDTKKSKVLIENMILSLGAYNKSVINFLSKLQFLFTDKFFKIVKFPHTRAIKGGKPMMKRGKSGKWLWLSQDWKPRWLKKKTKLILEEEWKCVPDKNVPFWN
ncbi:conserved Plasmodium protein, unknown function [Plasmodium malariae]|uniref:Thioredoxin domain-containing protein n=1 Tax=Plasmodium malariae TaxID=5858 RepID=A0A1A8WGN4_PLAMA|nr:conserved Plasmodium protein, unknown function [Plasmodium malariae]SBS90355.1 conserved Plasmodium protein, unknown function [Plasmodium malariae]SCP03299.1 conserved Plasmodium protein, unknown function [Plasmodium malariae]